ncbi:hypothetical protein HMPREF1861_00884 [Corynebacterium kroppenstedtii]|nr:hypothetical protein HMPREF1861_00884 [Corynebacterium kroppenstedtii]
MLRWSAREHVASSMRRLKEEWQGFHTFQVLHVVQRFPVVTRM